MILSRIDGKIYNAIMSSPAQICYICGTKLKEMNHLQNLLEKEADLTAYWFGLYMLHTSCLFHMDWILKK